MTVANVVALVLLALKIMNLPRRYVDALVSIVFEYSAHSYHSPPEVTAGWI